MTGNFTGTTMSNGTSYTVTKYTSTYINKL